MGLLVDNFAGGGGASTGIEAAMGRPVDIAVNHDPEALAMHAVNHPDTLHLCEDVWHVDPVAVCKGQPVDLAWFSPDCTHFSKAKGAKPREKKIRGLAWVAVRWAEAVSPAVIILENVEEFKTWGPLDDGGYPDKDRAGETFLNFIRSLQVLGYHVEWRELRACDYGAPTIRKRFFLVARCDGNPIVWPESTHGPGRIPYRTAAECIDWSLPCPSIFERAKPLADATCRRIARGIVKYVLASPNPFLIQYHGEKGKNDFRGQEIVRPINVIDTNPRYALVSPALVKNNFGDYPFQGLSTPLHTVTTQSNKFALVSAFLAKHYTGVVGSKIDEPIGTVTAVDHHSLVSAHVVRQFGQSTGSDCREPIGTITAGGMGHAQLVASFLVKYYGTSSAQDVSLPLDTITSRDRFGLVTVQIGGEDYVLADIGMRMLQPRELYRAQGFPEDYKIDFEIGGGKRITKTAQVRMVGNSVCPPLAEALVRANVTDAEREEVVA